MQQGSESSNPRQGNWQFSKEFLNEGTPSRKDSISLKKETSWRRLALAFGHDVGFLLKMNQYTIATAFVYWQRFFTVQSLAKNDPYLIAAACLLLAGKVEENFKSLQKITETAYFVRNKRDPKASEALRANQRLLLAEMDRVVKAEEVLLMTMNFEFQVSHPYRPLLLMVKELGYSKPTSDNSNTKFCQIAWNFANDSFRTTICLQPGTPSDLAATCLNLAATTLQIKIPNAPDGRPWFSRWDVKQDVLHDLEFQIMSLYKKKDGDSKTSPTSRVSLPATPSLQPSSREPKATGTPSPTDQADSTSSAQSKAVGAPGPGAAAELLAGAGTVPASGTRPATAATCVVGAEAPSDQAPTPPALKAKDGQTEVAAPAGGPLASTRTVKGEHPEVSKSEDQATVEPVTAECTIQPGNGGHAAGSVLVPKQVQVGVLTEPASEKIRPLAAGHRDAAATSHGGELYSVQVDKQAISEPVSDAPEGPEKQATESSQGNDAIEDKGPAELRDQVSKPENGVDDMEVDMDVSDDDAPPVRPSVGQLPTAGAAVDEAPSTSGVVALISSTSREEHEERGSSTVVLKEKVTPRSHPGVEDSKVVIQGKVAGSETSMARSNAVAPGEESILDIDEELMSQLEDVEVVDTGGKKDTVDALPAKSKGRKWEKEELLKGNSQETTEEQNKRSTVNRPDEKRRSFIADDGKKRGSGGDGETEVGGLERKPLHRSDTWDNKSDDSTGGWKEGGRRSEGERSEEGSGGKDRRRRHWDDGPEIPNRDRDRKRRGDDGRDDGEVDRRRHHYHEDVDLDSPRGSGGPKKKEKLSEGGGRWRGEGGKDYDGHHTDHGKFPGSRGMNGVGKRRDEGDRGAPFEASRHEGDRTRKRGRDFSQDRESSRLSGDGLLSGDEEGGVSDGREGKWRGLEGRHGGPRTFLRQPDQEWSGSRGGKGKDWDDHGKKPAGRDFQRNSGGPSREGREAGRERSWV